MTTTTPLPVINSYNEWDPLEEVIVGRVTGAAIPPWHVGLQSAAPSYAWDLLKALSGKPAPPQFVMAAQQDLDAFLQVFADEGIKVRRPDPLPQTGSFATPEWKSEAGYNLANPRDLLMVIGNEILETPTAWRCRYFETHAYRTLLHEYFRAGGKWSAAPKPRLADEFYDENYTVPEKGAPPRYSITEADCTFDAADFTRCGRDIFFTRSNATNELGLEWMRRHLGDEYRIHEIKTRSRQPLHIDTTFVPLAPGKALINPDYVVREELPPALKNWDCRYAPAPITTPGNIIDLSSVWLTMNVLMLDPTKVVVEAAQAPMVKMLEAWGFTCILVPFQNYYVNGGGFHCATLDVRRRGGLESYCD